MLIKQHFIIHKLCKLFSLSVNSAIYRMRMRHSHPFRWRKNYRNFLLSYLIHRIIHVSLNNFAQISRLLFPFCRIFISLNGRKENSWMLSVCMMSLWSEKLCICMYVLLLGMMKMRGIAKKDRKKMLKDFFSFHLAFCCLIHEKFCIMNKVVLYMKASCAYFSSFRATLTHTHEKAAEISFTTFFGWHFNFLWVLLICIFICCVCNIKLRVQGNFQRETELRKESASKAKLCDREKRKILQSSRAAGKIWEKGQIWKLSLLLRCTRLCMPSKHALHFE